MNDIFIVDLEVGKFYTTKVFPTTRLKILQKTETTITILRLQPLPVKEVYFNLKEFNLKSFGGYKGVPFIEVEEPPG